MDDGAGVEDTVGKLYIKARMFLKWHSHTGVMASGDRQLIREYEFSRELVDGVDQLIAAETNVVSPGSMAYYYRTALGICGLPKSLFPELSR